MSLLIKATLLFIAIYWYVVGQLPAFAAELTSRPAPVASIPLIPEGHKRARMAFVLSPHLAAIRCEDNRPIHVRAGYRKIASVLPVAKAGDICVVFLPVRSGTVARLATEPALGDSVAIYADDGRGFPAVAAAQITGLLNVSPALPVYQVLAGYDLGKDGAVLSKSGDLIGIVSSSEKMADDEVLYIAIPVRALLARVNEVQTSNRRYSPPVILHSSHHQSGASPFFSIKE